MSAPFKTDVLFLALQSLLVFLVEIMLSCLALSLTLADIMASHTHTKKKEKQVSELYVHVKSFLARIVSLISMFRMFIHS